MAAVGRTQVVVDATRLVRVLADWLRMAVAREFISALSVSKGDFLIKHKIDFACGMALRS